uniref:Uncharacterized protein n=1 Tax=Cacopsylla melanoneura TaxID=428564 RepID=A0A8D8REG7_9HEMI
MIIFPLRNIQGLMASPELWLVTIPKSHHSQRSLQQILLPSQPQQLYQSYFQRVPHHLLCDLCPPGIKVPSVISYPLQVLIIVNISPQVPGSRAQLLLPTYHNLL